MIINGARLFPLGCAMLLASSFAGAQIAPPQTPDTPADAAIPAQPATPATLPPHPPKVTCSGDQLTILADNSTLESILTAVKGCSGMHIEIPAGAGSVRSFEQLGPGPVRKVLDALLSGTQFNYVIQSSDTNPARVESVVMTARKKDSSSDAPSTDLALTPARRAWRAARQTGRPDLAAADDAQDTVEEVTAPKETPSAAPGDSADTNPVPAATTAPTIPVPGADAIANADPARTDDKITSMQQMFEQRRQLNMQQSPSTNTNQAPAVPPR